MSPFDCSPGERLRQAIGSSRPASRRNSNLRRVMGLVDVAEPAHAVPISNHAINLLVPRPESPQGAVAASPVRRLPPPDLPVATRGQP